MKIFQKLSILSLLLVTYTTSAIAGVIVNAPYGGATVSTPFSLSAWANWCGSQSVVAMGYSFDSNPANTIINGQSISASVGYSTGNHTLHVKAWGNGGGVCDTDVALNITGGSIVPPNAISVGSLQAASNWQVQHDPGTTGISTGAMAVINSPSRSGFAREFYSTEINYGGEQYHMSFGDDQTSTNFLYDVWVYLNNDAANIANLEFDMNQTMQNGQTVIYGFQCDGWTSTWDYTGNAGSPTSPKDVWLHSGAYCNPRAWSRNTWHHVQILYSRDGSGVVNYQSVYLDGNAQGINRSVPSAFALGWGPQLVTNFQVDGISNTWSSSTVILDEMTVYRW